MTSHWLLHTLSVLPHFLLLVQAAKPLPPASSFWVPSLPDIHQEPERPLNIYAGHLESDPKADEAGAEDVTAHLYFVLVKARKIADKERLVLWFNGGPGCSSFDGLMMEIGPWRYNGRATFDVAEGGWEEFTNILYIDQPAGTGFSYTSTDKYVHTMDEAIDQLFAFLTNFYKVFPQYKRMDTYLGGESYAGQYIPYFADAMLEDTRLNIPLKGIAIGNGWMDARNHYASYIEFLVKLGILPESSDEWKVAKEKTDACLKSFDENDAKEGHLVPIDLPACGNLLKDVAKIRQKEVNYKMMCINIYDVRYDDTYPDCGMNWPGPIHAITRYLDRNDVVEALHATAHPGKWIECRGSVHVNFKDQTFNSSITILPRVAERIPVLLFVGDQDYICNYVGIEAMLRDMEWAGGKGLGKVQTQSWAVDGKPAGTWVSSRNVTYAKIFNASHMAPYDVPHVTHDMMLRFMGVNWTLASEGTLKIPSSIGDDTKPLISLTNSQDDKPGATAGNTGASPEQSKAKWEAYYNAGSSALVLLLIAGGVAIFFWWRRRKAGVRLPVNNRAENGDAEETVPLTYAAARDEEEGFGRRTPSRKGKERATSDEDDSDPNERIFEVGDDDEEDQHQRPSDYNRQS